VASLPVAVEHISTQQTSATGYPAPAVLVEAGCPPSPEPNFLVDPPPDAKLVGELQDKRVENQALRDENERLRAAGRRRRDPGEKAKQRDEWIEKALARGVRPGETMSWDRFEEQLREDLSVAEGERGFSRRHLERTVRKIPRPK
jgi:hypothetical protein